jgi:drug/metabolite transporter (DMT)-like permease
VNPSPSSHPIAIALLSAALFGAATPASKWLLGSLSSLQLAGLLYLGAALGVAPALLRGRARWLPADRCGRRRLVGAIGLGGIAGPALLLLGLSLASAGSVSLWLSLELAATAAIGALFFHDRLGRAGWLGAALAVGAGVLLAGAEGRAGFAAAGLVAAACVCWAFDNHWTALLDGVPPAATTFWKGAVAGATNLALGALLAPLTAPAPVLAATLATGAVCYGASIVLYVRSAHSLGATRAQVLFSTAPLFGVGLAALGLDEPVGPAQLGAAFVLALSAALVLRDRHHHFHAHGALAHEHWHRHDDAHHAHPHEPAAVAHSHWHEHAPQAHSHPHWPDLHHRHTHGGTP